MVINALATPHAATNSNNSTTTPSVSSVTSDDFMTLLIAELQNQDPTQAMDPTTFMSQLVQINQLEQVMQINQTIQQLSNSAPSATSSNATS
jgi:flagellar basal-body rod modification protein FlgD